MYMPKAFAETNIENLFDFIEANSFGILFSQRDGHPFATHLPLLVERSSDSPAWLWGHFARANPHWQELEGEVLVVFPGPHAYISPAWYEAEKVVPTWNYVAVHVYGHLSLSHNEDELLKIVQHSVNFYEAGRPDSWQLDTSAEYVHTMLKAIVGFKIEITRLEGKWKLSQNHPLARQEKVVKALEQSPQPEAREVARLMARNLSKKC